MLSVVLVWYHFVTADAAVSLSFLFKEVIKNTFIDGGALEKWNTSWENELQAKTNFFEKKCLMVTAHNGETLPSGGKSLNYILHWLK